MHLGGGSGWPLTKEGLNADCRCRARAGESGRTVFIDSIDRRSTAAATRRGGPANVNLSARARAASRYQIMTSFKIPPQRPRPRAGRIRRMVHRTGLPLGPSLSPSPTPSSRGASRGVGTCTFLFSSCLLFRRPREKHADYDRRSPETKGRREGGREGGLRGAEE